MIKDASPPMLGRLAIYGFAALLVFLCGFPLLWMVLTSIKPTPELTQWPVRYLPTEPTLQHYKELVTRTSFAGNLLNSLIIATGAAIVGLGVSIPAGYAFSRFRFRGRRALMTGFLVINMFPIVLLIIRRNDILGLFRDLGRAFVPSPKTAAAPMRAAAHA